MRSPPLLATLRRRPLLHAAWLSLHNRYGSGTRGVLIRSAPVLAASLALVLLVVLVPMRAVLSLHAVIDVAPLLPFAVLLALSTARVQRARRECRLATHEGWLAPLYLARRSAAPEQAVAIGLGTLVLVLPLLASTGALAVRFGDPAIAGRMTAPLWAGVAGGVPLGVLLARRSDGRTRPVALAAVRARVRPVPSLAPLAWLAARHASRQLAVRRGWLALPVLLALPMGTRAGTAAAVLAVWFAIAVGATLVNAAVDASRALVAWLGDAARGRAVRLRLLAPTVGLLIAVAVAGAASATALGAPASVALALGAIGAAAATAGALARIVGR